MNASPKRILVTGATGFLGGWLCNRLAKDGWEVIALGRNKGKLEMLMKNGFETLTHDLRQTLPPLSETIPYIVHCAARVGAHGDYNEYWKDNVQATQNLVDWAKKHKTKRFINISTPSIYFEYRNKLNTEEHQVAKTQVNAYSKTKLEAEMLILKEKAIGPIALRPRGIYGPGDTTLLPTMLEAAKRGPLPQISNGNASTDLSFVDDVCDAIICALNAPNEAAGEAYNISSGETIRIQTIVEKVCKSANIAPSWKKLPYRPLRFLAYLMEQWSALNGYKKMPKLTQYSVGLFTFQESLNINKAITQLGWNPKTNFNDGLNQIFRNG